MLEGHRGESLYNRPSILPLGLFFQSVLLFFREHLWDVASHAWVGCCFLSNAFLLPVALCDQQIGYPSNHTILLFSAWFVACLLACLLAYLLAYLFDSSNGLVPSAS